MLSNRKAMVSMLALGGYVAFLYSYSSYTCGCLRNVRCFTMRGFT